MILYHYCSQQAFLSIVSSASFWCSSLSLSNDSMEGRWVHKIFDDVCDDNKLNSSGRIRVGDLLKKLNTGIEGLGFCLSEEADQLGQWRGYGQNASGVSIGFSKEALETLSSFSSDQEKIGFSLRPVNYNIDHQKNELEPTVHKIKNLIDEGAFRSRGLLTTFREGETISEFESKQKKAFVGIAMQLLPLMFHLFEFKNPTFSEEKEWRIISFWIKQRELQVDFRARGDQIIPYRSFSFQDKRHVIREVVLGSKNRTPTDVVKLLLAKYGYEDVVVRRSGSTYQ